MTASHKPRLGEVTDYPERYDPELLVSIPRQEGRSLLPNVGGFKGVDRWTAYELSWLDVRGKPQVMIAEFSVPCDSPNIVESKSFKLYLNSLNQARFQSRLELQATLARDLATGFGVAIEIQMFSLDEYAGLGLTRFPGQCIDELDIETGDNEPCPSLLKTGTATVTEQLYSHLLKSNCPVTGQPDWASVLIGYSGRQIDHSGLLRYLVSFRQHQDFHEHCVERIFADLMTQCRPESLTVYARYTRRGGLDINPYRTTGQALPGFDRLARQ